MSGVWTNALNLDLVIPSNGALTPGSGTIYIGGPRLPAEVSGFRGGLIFYSTTVESANIKYWFILHDDSNGGMVEGYCDSAGTLHYMDTLIRSGTFGDESIFKGDVFRIGTSVAPVSFVDMNLSQLIMRGSGSILTVDGLTTLFPYLKQTVGNQEDVWKQNTSTQTVAGVANTVIRYDYRITPDYIVDVRFDFTFPAAPGSCNFSSAALAGLANVLPDNSTTGFGPGGVVLANDGQCHQAGMTTAGALRVNGTFTNPGGAFIFQGSMVYTKAKP